MERVGKNLKNKTKTIPILKSVKLNEILKTIPKSLWSFPKRKNSIGSVAINIVSHRQIKLYKVSYSSTYPKWNKKLC